MSDTESNPQEAGQVANTTIAEELRAAFAEAEAREEKPAKEPGKPEVKVEEPEAEQAPDEPEAEEEAEEAAEDKTEKEFPLIPNNWSAEEKEAFQKLLDSDNEDVQAAAEIFIERHNSMKKTFFKKTEELANVKKELQPIQEVFAPFEQHMKNNGVDKASYIKNMVTWEMSLQQDPVNTVKQIMSKFGVKPEQIAPRDEFSLDDDDLTDSPKSDKVTKLEQEIQLLRTQIANQPVLAQVRQFEEATDATGKLLHPHFAEVKPIMGQLIQQGKAKTLEDAYKKAIKALELEEEVVTDESDSAVDLDKIRQKLVKAKKASKGVSTKGSKPDYTSMSVKEELRARWNNS